MGYQEKRTEISSIGEFGLIDKIKNKFQEKYNSNTHLGIGDDAAVIDFKEKFMVVTTDMLVEGIHFDLAYTPLPHLGYKSVAINISDISAMNATPTQITVSIAISNRFSVEAVEALYDGIKKACEKYRVDLIGGDTTSSKSGLVISITALGEVEREKVTLRSGASKNDIICVTGNLGGAYIGLQILEREKQVYLVNPDMQPDLGKYDYIVQRQLKPEARFDFVKTLQEKNIIPSSMIDVSDGLASELLHISKNSNVGMHIFEDKIPIDKQTQDAANELSISPITCALNGGEDYELLFTIKQTDFEILKNEPDLHFIGYVQDISKGNYMTTAFGEQIDLRAQGWNHFLQK